MGTKASRKMSDIHDVPSFQMKMSYFFLAFLDVLSSKYQKNTKDLGLSEPSPRKYQFFFLPPSLLPRVSQKKHTNKTSKKWSNMAGLSTFQIPIFEKVDYWGLKDPLEVRV